MAEPRKRKCHHCKKNKEAQVWFARTEKVKGFLAPEKQVRVHWCAECFYGLPEEERKQFFAEQG
jgi:hypothetical protein